jgi:hypothetical protein
MLHVFELSEHLGTRDMSEKPCPCCIYVFALVTALPLIVEVKLTYQPYGARHESRLPSLPYRYGFSYMRLLVDFNNE